jgi:hypothetical protein
MDKNSEQVLLMSFYGRSGTRQTPHDS